MPKPRAGEKRQDYLSRCMADPNERQKHPDQKERYAACNGYWESERKSEGVGAMDFDELIQSIQQRKTETCWGIGTAAQYLRSVEACIPEGIKQQADWSTIVKAAERSLTYCDEEMGKTEQIVKSFSDGTELPDGFCASFDCTLTSRRKDRDGDVLEPAGFEVDQEMPLLWQHVPVQPTGKHFQVIQQDDDRIRSKFGVVDTPFGRDNAVLVKAGVLRMSHGFKPYEFEPIQHKDAGDGVPSGWHVKRGEIREASLVSIPSNVDGVIEAYSRGQLKTPVFQAWAKEFFDGRPVIVPVQLDLTKPDTSGHQHQEDIKSAGDNAPKDAPKDAPKVDKAGRVLSAANFGRLEQASGLLTEVLASAALEKGDEPLEVKASSDIDLKQLGVERNVPGSFEWIRDKLRDTATDYLRAKGVDLPRDQSWVYMLATFPDRAVVCCEAYDRKETPCYQVAYGVGDNGPTWTGEPIKVEVTPQIVEKSIAAHKGEAFPPITKSDDLATLERKVIAKAIEQEDGEAMLRDLVERLGGVADEWKKQSLAEFLWG